MTINAPPGVFDILPKDEKNKWRQSHLWNFVENVMRETALQYGFQEIRTPLLERAELFQRGVGETSDIVSKEMYTFEDKGKRLLSLRPEGTAPVARAYIEHSLGHKTPILKVFYIGPMFRYERTQAGRYRQHHQFGAEAIGTPLPEQDAELIDLLYTLYSRLGLQNLKVMINSLGDSKCREKYKESLKQHLKKHFENLSSDSQNRFEKNPLRILDSKDPKDIKILENAPSLLDFLDSASRDHFERVLTLLKFLKIPYTVNDKIVRGLDYYNQTVYEVVSSELGAQNSIGAGGRYDHLVAQLGGSDIPSTGFATGIERIIQTMLGQKVSLPEPYRPTLYLIPLGDQALQVCFQILHELRENKIKAEMDFSQRKVSKIMAYADQIQTKFVAVIGEKELESQEVALKNMETGDSVIAPLYHLSRILRIEVEGDDFIRIWKEMNTPFEHPLEAKFFVERLKNSIEMTKNLTEELQTAMKKMQDMI